MSWISSLYMTGVAAAQLRWQIWMGFKESNKYPCKIKTFDCRDINVRSFSDSHHRPVLPISFTVSYQCHDDVTKWKHFPRYWRFVRGIHLSQMNSPYKGQWHGALVFCSICDWINGWVNNREACDLRRRRALYDVILMGQLYIYPSQDRPSIIEINRKDMGK